MTIEGKWQVRAAMAVCAICAFLIFVLPVVHKINIVEDVATSSILSPPPIEVINQTIKWVGQRTLETRSEGAVWNKTCHAVWILRGVTMIDGTFVPLPAKVISGPLVGLASGARFSLTITPQQRASSVLQMTLPDTRNADGSYKFKPEDVSYYQVTYTVLDSDPCVDGYAGAVIKRISVPDHVTGLTIDPIIGSPLIQVH